VDDLSASAAASQERALALAYRYLNRRERTVSEMRSHLLGRGIEPDTVAAALQELGEHGYLGDRRFACLLAHDKRQLEGWGSERIRRELLARGVDRDLAEEAVGDNGEGELARAIALLRRRFSPPLRERRERERALGVLLRKGYDYELAVEALAAHGHD
jgi:regulatory protein